MAISVTCSGCGVVLSTPDSSAGKHSKCPRCGTAIEIPPAANDAYEVEPQVAEPATTEPSAGADERRPCPACGEMIMRAAIKCRFCGKVFDSSFKKVLGGPGKIDEVAWRKVRSGLSTYYNCVGIMVGVVVVVILVDPVARMLLGDQPNQEGHPALLIFLGISGLVLLCAGVGMFVGLVRCTNVPKQSGAHGYAVGAVGLMVGNLLLSLVAAGGETDVISAVASLLSVLGWVLFILFIKRSANYLRDYQLASSAGRFLWFLAAFGAGAFFLGVLSVVAAPILLGVLALCSIFGVLGSFIWFLRLVRGLKLAIENELEGVELGAAVG